MKGHIILYSILNQQEGLLCDRAYFPGPDMAALLERYHKRLFGVESRHALSDFDVLGFSLSYELGGTNILEMLKISGIPLTGQVGGVHGALAWCERRRMPAWSSLRALLHLPLLYPAGTATRDATSAGAPTTAAAAAVGAEGASWAALGPGGRLLPPHLRRRPHCHQQP